MLIRKTLPFRPGDIQQANRQRQESAEVPQTPAISGHSAHILFRHYLRQKSRNQIFAAREHNRGNGNRRHSGPDIARSDQRQRSRGHDANDGGKEQKPFFAGPVVGHGAYDRSADHDYEISDADG